MNFLQIIADFSLPSKEFSGEITANHTFHVQNSKHLWYLGTKFFWCFANDGVNQVMSLNAFRVDTKHTARDIALVLGIRESKLLLICQVIVFLDQSGSNGS